MKAQRSAPQTGKRLSQRVKQLAFEVASLVNGLLPCRNMVSLCSIPDYTDSARAVFDHILRSGCARKWTIVWHVKDPKAVREEYEANNSGAQRVYFVRKNRFMSFIMFCLSRVIIDTHGLYSMVKLKNRQMSLYTTHGMPVKKFGFEYDNDIALGVQHADYALATSEFYRGVISRSMNIDEDHVLPGCLPRNDIFFEDDGRSDEVGRALGSDFFIYLPTYRVSIDQNRDNGRDLNRDGYIFGGTVEEWGLLNEQLRAHGTRIIIKPHPMEAKRDLTPIQGLSQIAVIDDAWILKHGFSLNLIMKYSKGLITDYSGAFIDYMLTDKPIVFYVPDYTEYKQSRGYVFEDMSGIFPGPRIDRFLDLPSVLFAEDGYRDKRAEVRKLVNSQTAPTASRKVCDLLLGSASKNTRRKV